MMIIVRIILDSSIHCLILDIFPLVNRKISSIILTVSCVCRCWGVPVYLWKISCIKPLVSPEGAVLSLDVMPLESASVASEDYKFENENNLRVWS